MKLRRLLTLCAVALGFTLSTPATAKADPISTAVVGFFTLTGTAAAVATFVINTALYAAGSWALTKAASALGLIKNAVAERQASVTSLTLGESPRELVIGEACTGGTLVDAWNWGGKYGTDYVTRCIALADHEVDRLVGYYVDDQYYTFTSNGNQAAFNGALRLIFVNATANGSNPPADVGASNGGWTNADKVVGVTHVWVVTKVDDKVWTQGHPRFKFVLRGLKAYDPRRDAALGYTGPNPHVWENPATHAFTRNAAVLRYNFQRGVYATGRQGQDGHLLIGRGLSAEEAPPARIIAAANLCDEIVDGEARYTANGVISAAQTFIEVEEMFAAAMAGVIVQRDGGVEVEPGQAKAVVKTITDADLVAGEPVSFSNFLPDTDGGRINTVIPRYVEPAQGWKDHGGIIRRDPADLIEDGRPLEMTLPLMLVTSGKQADRCAEIARRKGRLERRASIVLPPDYAEVEEGDWIAWTSARYANGATVRWQITSYSMGPDWRQHLTLEEIASSVYGVADPEPDTTNPPPPPVPVDALELFGVKAEAITLAGTTSAIPAIRFTWGRTFDEEGGVDEEEPNDAALVQVRAEIRLVGETQTASMITDDIETAVWVITNGVTPDQTLECRLTPIASSPTRPVVPSAWMTVTTTPLIAVPTDPEGFDTTPPDVPTGLALSSTSTINSATGQPFIKIIATWDAVTADDLDRYDVEITQGGFTITEYAGADAAPRYERVAVTGAVYSIRVRAVDKAGNASDWTASANVTGAGDTVAPAAPTGLIVGQGLTHLRLSWVNPSVNDLAKIEIYENTTNNSGTATKIDTIGAGTGYTRGGLSSGQTRYYWLKAVDTSGNTSGFSTGASGTVQSVQVTDFASTIAAPILASNNADATTKAGGDSTGKFYLNTTDQKLYRGTGGSGWTKAVDGADIVANSIVAGTIAAGAIGTTELAAGAVTAIKIGADQVNATHMAAGSIVAEAIAAGTITGDKLNITTNLPPTITVGTTGVSIGTVESRASDPAARVNANSTLIQPGRVLLTGSTALSSWLLGSDQTLLDGGKIGANTVAANKLEIGARGLSFIGLNFTSSGNTLSWSAGEVQWVDDNGTPQTSFIGAGSVTASTRIYVYWQKGASSLSTGSFSTATATNRVIVCSYFGGTNFNPIYGRTIIDGPYIRTGAITADKITTTDLAAISADLGNITAGNINMVAGSRRVRLSPGFGSGSNIILWAGPTSVASGSETTLNGTLVLTADGSGDFFGGKTLSAPFDSGAGSTVTVPSTSYVDVAVSATIRTVNASQILTYLTGTVRMQAPADPENGASAAWRVVHTNTSGGDVVVMRSGTFLASATGSVVSQSVEALITQANANWWASVAASRTGDRIVRFQLARSGPTIFLDIQTPRLRGFYAT